jgi:hypothetical protein
VVWLVAVGILTSMVFWMKKAGHSVKAHLHDSIEGALRPGPRQGVALIGMAFFAVAREGLEAVFFLLAIVQQSSGPATPLAGLAGLQSRLRGLTLPPDKVVGGAAALIEEVAATKISGEDDRYSRTDLWDFRANVDGVRKIVDLVRPLTAQADKALGSIPRWGDGGIAAKRGGKSSHKRCWRFTRTMSDA